MGVFPARTRFVRQTSRFSRLAQLVRDHPLLALASALGSLGTFAAGMTAFAGLLGAGHSGGIGEAIRVDELGLPPQIPYTYVTVSDDTGRISVEVPVGWTGDADGWHAVDLPPVPNRKRIGPGLNAAPSVSAWRTDLKTPGVFIGASQELLRTHAPGKVLDQIFFRPDCKLWAREAYAKGPYEGDRDPELSRGALACTRCRSHGGPQVLGLRSGEARHDGRRRGVQPDPVHVRVRR
jgi:hypothetical protein